MITTVEVNLQSETLLKYMGRVVRLGQKTIEGGMVQRAQDGIHRHLRLQNRLLQHRSYCLLDLGF